MTSIEVCAVAVLALLVGIALGKVDERDKQERLDIGPARARDRLLALRSERR
jgi:hypothetical protein